MPIRTFSTAPRNGSTTRFGTSKGLIKILFCAVAFHGIFLISCKVSDAASLFHSFLPLVQAFTPKSQYMICTNVRAISRSLASSHYSMLHTKDQRTPALVSLAPIVSHQKRNFCHNKSHRKSTCFHLSSGHSDEEPVHLTGGESDNDDTLDFDDRLNSSNRVVDETISSDPTPGSLLSPISSQQSEWIMSNLGEFDPSKKIPIKREVLVGDPQIKIRKKEKSVSAILQELAAIQQQGPRKYCILGTRHCSYLHQQIIELLSYALVLSENHVYTSGAGGTNAAAIRGALRAERPDLLTVILPQSLHKQPRESQELLRGVTDLIAMPQNDDLSLDVASRVCNSKLLSETDQLIAFAFHESKTVIEATKEAKKLEMLVTMLFLD
eukprot:CAMPEP_0176478170 /NCGR_PEP_ID=MMETSP0200_2-20121128/1039_1 /TAXON_ID=947934 /ORGANISM="Chaetoceros sp., Strain GSL56" /LENGTH=380 /DNA_ID=CAMNT_0017874081 /DNA_START=310 /DNA_END=1452 /DNA_ORIENTATION=+